MSFKNLEQRYNENVQTLYRGAKQKFDNGRSSTGANDDPLITRKPGDGYWSRAEGRSTPFTSSITDVKRLTLFTLSSRGVAFLLKQQLLQTGNTFEQTRFINPLFAVGAAAAPGLGNAVRVRRHLRPITGGPGGPLLGRTDTSFNNVKKLGQLQKETYDSLVTTESPTRFLKKIPVIGPTLSAFTAKKNIGEELVWEQSRPELGKESEDYFVPKLLVAPVANTPISGIFNALKKAILGDNVKTGRGGFLFGGKVYTDTFSLQNYGAMGLEWDGRYKTYLLDTNDTSGWSHTDFRRIQRAPDVPDIDQSATSRSRLLSPLAQTNGILKHYQTTDTYYFDGRTVEAVVNKQEEAITKQPTIFTPDSPASPGRRLAGLLPTSGDTQSFLEYFRSNNTVGINSRTQGNLNAHDLAAAARTGDDPSAPRRALSYIKDTSNILVKTGTDGAPGPYKNINSNFADPVNISFAMGKAAPVYFRAYIKDLQETASPQYKDYQYIGRIEKFISYVSVQRTISFKLGVLAFAQDEVEGVWTRLNYLTGMVFPYGWTKGIFQPNIIRLTIGNVYYDQPGYITSLSKNFNELTESWDIDKEVPIAATVNMQFTLIEKSAKIATSPFYGITEDNTTIFNTSVTEGPPTGEESLQTSVQQRNPSITTTSAVQQLRNIPVPKPPIPSINTTIPLPTGLTSP